VKVEGEEETPRGDRAPLQKKGPERAGEPKLGWAWKIRSGDCISSDPGCGGGQGAACVKGGSQWASWWNREPERCQKRVAAPSHESLPGTRELVRPAEAPGASALALCCAGTGHRPAKRGAFGGIDCCLECSTLNETIIEFSHGVGRRVEGQPAEGAALADPAAGSARPQGRLKVHPHRGRRCLGYPAVSFRGCRPSRRGESSE